MKVINKNLIQIYNKRFFFSNKNKNEIYIFNKKNLSQKYIPLQKLNFEDIGYNEKVSLIYDQNQTLQRKYKNKKFLTYSCLFSILSLTSYMGLSIYSLGISSIIFPVIYTSLKKQNKYCMSFVKKIYLCRNGHQIILVTFDDYYHLLNIKDIKNIKFFDIKKFKEIIPKENKNENSLENENKDEVFLFETFDKKFIINANPKFTKYYNSEIFDAFNTRNIVATNTSYSHYNRILFPRVDENIKLQINPKIIKYKIPKEFFNSYNTFLKLLNLKKTHLFYRLYYPDNFSYGLKHRYFNLIYNGRLINNKEFEKFKRKFKLQFYSNTRFESKFGENLYRIVADLNSMKPDSKEFLELTNKLQSATSNGRRILYFKKRLYS